MLPGDDTKDVSADVSAPNYCPECAGEGDDHWTRCSRGVRQVENYAATTVQDVRDALVLARIFYNRIPELPCRIDEMTEREYAIYEITAQLTADIKTLVEILEGTLKLHPTVRDTISQTLSAERARICGNAANMMIDRLMENGYPGKRHDLVRWLTWLTLVGAHPEMYRKEFLNKEDSTKEDS